MRTLLITALGLVVTAGVAARSPSWADDQPAKGGAEAKAGPAKAAVVAVGWVQLMEVAEVGAQVAGAIQKITVDYGVAVKAGDVLAQLEPARYEAEVNRAQAGVERAQAKMMLARAQFTLAKRQLERLAKLRDAKAVDESEFETAKAQLEVGQATLAVEEAGMMESKAALKRAALDLSHCTIRSPIDGVVIDRRCRLGQSATASSAASLFVIGDPRRVQVLASVKETDISRIDAGQAVDFTVDAFPRQTWHGRVAQVRLNAATSKGRVMYTVVIPADNPDGKLLPSMTARVSIAASEKR